MLITSKRCGTCTLFCVPSILSRTREAAGPRFESTAAAAEASRTITYG